MGSTYQRSNSLTKPAIFALGAFCFLLLWGIYDISVRSIDAYGGHSSLGTAHSGKMGIVHIVMFEFKEDVTGAQVTETVDNMLALKDKCLHPTSKKPYVKTVMGGKENSPEGLAGGLTHIFVVEFENGEDRKYYLEQDPAHLAFVKGVGDVVKKVQVVDFNPGVF